jgi:hypothetical protein
LFKTPSDGILSWWPEQANRRVFHSQQIDLEQVDLYLILWVLLFRTIRTWTSSDFSYPLPSS